MQIGSTNNETTSTDLSWSTSTRSQSIRLKFETWEDVKKSVNSSIDTLKDLGVLPYESAITVTHVKGSLRNTERFERLRDQSKVGEVSQDTMEFLNSIPENLRFFAKNLFDFYETTQDKNADPKKVEDLARGVASSFYEYVQIRIGEPLEKITIDAFESLPKWLRAFDIKISSVAGKKGDYPRFISFFFTGLGRWYVGSIGFPGNDLGSWNYYKACLENPKVKFAKDNVKK